MLRSALVAVLLGTAHAFAPLTSNRALIRGVPAYAEADLVTVNDDNVKASVAITGFAAGFVLGGPVTGAIGSALANYIANKEGEVGDTTQAAGKTLLLLYNLLLKANSKLELTDKISEATTTAVDKAKAGASGETVVKITDALDTVLAKSSELEKEYALTAAVKDLLAKAADLSVEAIDSALKFADENDVTGKAVTAAKELAAKGKSSIKEPGA